MHDEIEIEVLESVLLAALWEVFDICWGYVQEEARGGVASDAWLLDVDQGSLPYMDVEDGLHGRRAILRVPDRVEFLRGWVSQEWIRPEIEIVCSTITDQIELIPLRRESLDERPGRPPDYQPHPFRVRLLPEETLCACLEGLFRPEGIAVIVSLSLLIELDQRRCRRPRIYYVPLAHQVFQYQKDELHVV